MMTARQIGAIRRHLLAITAVIDDVKTDRAVDREIAGRQLGDRIRNAIRIAGLTQQKLANHIGMEPAQLCRIMTGRTDPSVGTLRKIADALGVTVASLIP